MAEITVKSAEGGKERFPLVRDRVTIGRSRESDIFLPDQWLSRHHAEIRRDGGVFLVVDLGSKNGTLLNGDQVASTQRLRHGDVITLGEHILTFSDDTAGEDEAAPEGTRIFSAKELSDIRTRPSLDPEELARQSRVLGVLQEAMRKLVEHRPLAELFGQVLDLLFEAVPAERGAILLLEGEPPLPVIKASRARQGQSPPTKVSRSIARKVVDDQKSLLMPNLMEDAAFSTQDSILSTGIRSAVCAPLLFTSTTGGQDSVIGLVYLDSLMRSRPFTEDDLRVVTALANLAAAKIENVRLLEESLEKRRMEDDMRVAAEIQRGLLPNKDPVVAGYGIVGSNTPSRSVGGDYYDFAVHEGRLLFALGDVSGKGTGAALLMTVLRAAVRGHWADGSVEEAVGRINSTVCQNVTAGKYITFFVGRLDPATGRIRYVNAGHNPPVLVRPNAPPETLTCGGMVLGMFDPIPYQEGEAVIGRGEALLVFSDGVTETWSPEDEEFAEDRLLEVASRNVVRDARGLHDAILAAVDAFANGRKPADDRTLIVIKRD
jgi:sigma-B regulation protein RsbU (phosphoserine phosphatase)